MAYNFHKILLGILILTLALSLPVSGASAGEAKKFSSKREYMNWKNKNKKIPPSERSCGIYLEQVSLIYKGARPKNYFRNLRSMYARCTFYDPFSEDTLRNLAELYEKAIGDDPVEAPKALRTYKSLVQRHLANLAVVTMALDMAREDSRFGNPDLFQEVQSMIIESLKTTTRDGSEPSMAIEIITTGEQDYIVANSGGKLVDSELIEQNGVFYYALDFEDEENGEKFSMFLDVSTPMIVTRTRQQQAEKEERLNVKASP